MLQRSGCYTVATVRKKSQGSQPSDNDGRGLSCEVAAGDGTDQTSRSYTRIRAEQRGWTERKAEAHSPRITTERKRIHPEQVCCRRPVCLRRQQDHKEGLHLLHRRLVTGHRQRQELQHRRSQNGSEFKGRQEEGLQVRQ